jgi:hypothetical protein
MMKTTCLMGVWVGYFEASTTAGLIAEGQLGMGCVCTGPILQGFAAGEPTLALTSDPWEQATPTESKRRALIEAAKRRLTRAFRSIRTA